MFRFDRRALARRARDHVRAALAPIAAKLIPDLRHAHRLWSVRLSAIGATLLALAIAAPEAVTTVWAQLPPELLARLPANTALTVPLAIQLAAGVARLVRQRKSDADA